MRRNPAEAFNKISVYKNCSDIRIKSENGGIDFDMEKWLF